MSDFIVCHFPDGSEGIFRKDLIQSLTPCKLVNGFEGTGIEMLGAAHPGYAVVETVAQIREMIGL